MIYCRKFDCHRDIRIKLYSECTKMHYLHNSHFKKYKNSFESMICYAPNNDSCDDVKLIVCDFDSNCKICNKVFFNFNNSFVWGETGCPIILCLVITFRHFFPKIFKVWQPLLRQQHTGLLLVVQKMAKPLGVPVHSDLLRAWQALLQAGDWLQWIWKNTIFF